MKHPKYYVQLSYSLNPERESKNVLTNPAYRKYIVQKSGAKRRGINWRFTFESWVKWWEYQLGPDWMKLRGKGSDQYQMARKGDKGPYAPWNIRCLRTHEHLTTDRSRNGVEWHAGNLGPVIRQITQIEKMLLEGKTVHKIATELGVSSTSIYRHFPKGILSVMQKHGIKSVTVQRYCHKHTFNI